MRKMLHIDLNDVPSSRTFSGYDVTWALDEVYAKGEAERQDFDYIFCSFPRASSLDVGFVEWMVITQPYATVVAEMPRSSAYLPVEREMRRKGASAVTRGSLDEEHAEVELLGTAAASRRLRTRGFL